MPPYQQQQQKTKKDDSTINKEQRRQHDIQTRRLSQTASLPEMREVQVSVGDESSRLLQQQREQLRRHLRVVAAQGKSSVPPKTHVQRQKKHGSGCFVVRTSRQQPGTQKRHLKKKEVRQHEHQGRNTA